jgi:hypothetical protein
VKAAENRNFQDPSKTTFLGRNSSEKKTGKKGNPQESWQERVFGVQKIEFLKTGVGNLVSGCIIQ